MPFIDVFGFAFVPSVGARVAARSARCLRWLSPTIKLVYQVHQGCVKCGRQRRGTQCSMLALVESYDQVGLLGPCL